jgi:hypothetical protein
LSAWRVAATLGVALALAGCDGARPACFAAGACDEGTTCVAGRCVAAGEPIDGPERSLVRLAASAVAAWDEARPSRSIVGLTLGRRAAGQTTVLLEFGPIPDDFEATSTTLVIVVDGGAPTTVEPIELVVAPIASAWDAATAGSDRAPLLDAPVGRASVPRGTSGTVRIPIEPRAIAGAGPRVGLALLARGDDPGGLVLGATPPRLELTGASDPSAASAATSASPRGSASTDEAATDEARPW